MQSGLWWTALIYKAADPRILKGKGKHQLPSFVQEGLDNENPFSRLVPLMLCLCSQKYLASRLPFKVLLTWDNAPGHPDPQECSTNGVEVVSLPPNTMSVSQPLDQGVIGPLGSSHRVLYGNDCQCSGKRTPTEQTSWEPRRLTPSKMPSLLQKRPWKPSSPKQYIPAGEILSRCAWLHRIDNRAHQGNHERDCE